MKGRSKRHRDKTSASNDKRGFKINYATIKKEKSDSSHKARKGIMGLDGSMRYWKYRGGMDVLGVVSSYHLAKAR